ncbi:MAG: hypothetical protein AAF581_00870 [Planctomycetota bacterium]
MALTTQGTYARVGAVWSSATGSGFDAGPGARALLAPCFVGGAFSPELLVGAIPAPHRPRLERWFASAQTDSASQLDAPEVCTGLTVDLPGAADCELLARALPPGLASAGVTVGFADMASFQSSQFRYQNSLRVVGHFTPGILHEIRNPMTVFRSVEYCLRPESQTKLEEPHIGMLVEQVQRVDGLLESFMRTVADSAARQRRSFDQLLDDLRRLLQKTFLTRGIDLDVELSGSAIAETTCARDLLLQVGMFAVESLCAKSQLRVRLENAAERPVLEVTASTAVGAAPDMDPCELLLLETMAHACGASFELTTVPDGWQLLLTLAEEVAR